MSRLPRAEANLLLEQLPKRDALLIGRHLQSVTLEPRHLICHPGQALEFAYFPIATMLSSVIVFSDGSTIETATVGKEGMVGVGLIADERSNPFRVIAQVKGEAVQIPATKFTALLNSSDALRSIVQRYMLTLLRQCGQNAACNLRHPLTPRMGRWLLQTSDRAGRDDFRISQEFLSQMLGVSRQTINAAARSLQKEELIEYNRGHVRLLKRAGLQQVACECYDLYNGMYQRYMGRSSSLGAN